MKSTTYPIVVIAAASLFCVVLFVPIRFPIFDRICWEDSTSQAMDPLQEAPTVSFSPVQSIIKPGRAKDMRQSRYRVERQCAFESTHPLRVTDLSQLGILSAQSIPVRLSDCSYVSRARGVSIGDDGNLYRPEGDGASFAYGTFSELDFNKKSNEDEADWSDIQELFDVLHSDYRITDPVLWRSSLESILNVDEFLRWLAVNTVIQNWDTYGIMTHNYYLYHDPDGSLLTWIPWDNNEALQQGGAISLALDEVGNEWPLIRFLIDDTVYWVTYNQYVGSTVESAFESSRVITRYQTWRDLVQPYVTGLDGEIEGYTFLESAGDFDSEVSFLINHVSDRQAAAATYLESVQ